MAQCWGKGRRGRGETVGGREGGGKIHGRGKREGELREIKKGENIKLYKGGERERETVK